MNQKKTLFFAASALMLVASFLATPKAKAETAPGEGFYTGAFIGYGSGLVSAKVVSFGRVGGTGGGLNSDGTFESKRGGLGLGGIQGGGWAGWGMKTADDLYFGAEVSGAGSDEKFQITTSDALRLQDTQTDITSITAQRMWTAGGALRVGYYVNSDTLFSLKGGVAISQFDVEIGSNSNSYYAGGPQMGGSIETKLSKLDPNLSLRMEFVYTNYLTANVLAKTGQVQSGSGTGGGTAELTGHDSAGRIGVQYSF